MSDDPILEGLAAVPLFASLTKRDLKSIRQSGSEVTFNEGDPITHEGLQGGDFYLMLKGEAAVETDGQVVNELGPGDYFGELALITGKPRTATVRATSRVLTLRLDSEAFRALLEQHGEIAYAILVEVAKRLQGDRDRAAS